MTGKDALSRAQIELLATLTAGDQVEVFNERGTVHWRGTVELSVPDLGVAWIHTDTCERKLLDMQEHSVRRILTSAAHIAAPALGFELAPEPRAGQGAGQTEFALSQKETS